MSPSAFIRRTKALVAAEPTDDDPVCMYLHGLIEALSQLDDSTAAAVLRAVRKAPITELLLFTESSRRRRLSKRRLKLFTDTIGSMSLVTHAEITISFDSTMGLACIASLQHVTSLEISSDYEFDFGRLAVCLAGLPLLQLLDLDMPCRFLPFLLPSIRNISNLKTLRMFPVHTLVNPNDRYCAPRDMDAVWTMLQADTGLEAVVLNHFDLTRLEHNVQFGDANVQGLDLWHCTLFDAVSSGQCQEPKSQRTQIFGWRYQ